MVYVEAFWAVVFALIAVPVSIVEGALRREPARQNLAEAWAFLRLILIGVFALLVGQALAPSGYLWWVNVLIALAITLLMVLLTQVAAKYLASHSVGAWLLRVLAPVIRRLNLLFTPLRSPISDQPEEYEQELLESVEEFTETIAREVMVPRVDMATVPADATLEEAMKAFLDEGYSRLPVTDKNVDDVVGVLYLKDISRIAFEQPKTLKKALATDFARKVMFAPESKGVDDLLREMQAKATHIAIVIDEYGGVAGLVTLEDLIEEIVGEIADEYDDDEREVVELGDGRYRIAASYSLDDLGELLELELGDEDVDSVGGLLVKELGRLARVGESATVSGIVITAERIESKRKRLISVIVEKTAAAQGFEEEVRNDA